MQPVLINPNVDRSCEQDEEPQIFVTFEDGHIERFFIAGLSDDEYIARAIAIRDT